MFLFGENEFQKGTTFPKKFCYFWGYKTQSGVFLVKANA